MTATAGTLALVGGSEWTAGCDFDAELLAAAGTTEVLVLPTAAAYEHPERAVVRAGEWFESLGALVEGLMVLSRADAEDPGAVAVVRRHRFVYVGDGSPLHLRSVLKGSAVFDAVVEVWRAGGVVAGAGAGAMVLTDPMVDPRGGALTVGLGMVPNMAVISHFGEAGEDAHGEKLHRSVALAPDALPVVGVPPRTALVHDSVGWRVTGAGQVAVFVNGVPAPAGLGALPDAT